RAAPRSMRRMPRSILPAAAADQPRVDLTGVGNAGKRDTAKSTAEGGFMMRRTGRLVLATLAVLALARLAAAATAEDQLVSYYRKKNNLGPTTKVTVQGLKDSTAI